MQGTRRVKETINRGITAVAMTVAIAIIYAAITPDGQISREAVLRQQVQAIFKFRKTDRPVTHREQDSQESLTTLLLGPRDGSYGH